ALPQESDKCVDAMVGLLQADRRLTGEDRLDWVVVVDDVTGADSGIIADVQRYNSPNIRICAPKMAGTKNAYLTAASGDWLIFCHTGQVLAKDASECLD